MRRRSRATITLFALLVVGSTIVVSPPRDPALAADPLADARAEQQALQDQLEQHRAELKELQATSDALATQLDIAEAELAEVTAEYERVSGLLAQVRIQVNEMRAQLEELQAQIAEMDAAVAALEEVIAQRTDELLAREALLQDHLRSAYETSQTSLLEVLLSAESLDDATAQVGYLLTISEQDRDLADEIRDIRAQLEIEQAALRESRALLAEAREAARLEQRKLIGRVQELELLELQVEKLRAAAEQKRREQEAALNAALDAEADVEGMIAEEQQAFAAANALVDKLEAEARALEEARRRAAEALRNGTLSPQGFRWPMDYFRVTQEWGPTSFRLEPAYNYKGTYYPHFHGGIDLANACGTPIKAAGFGVVVASGQPLLPWDSGFGVVIDHGGGIQTWYWHITTQVVVRRGQVVDAGQVIGYEGTTGRSTGCHLHFGVNQWGWWENPRWYLP